MTTTNARTFGLARGRPSVSDAREMRERRDVRSALGAALDGPDGATVAAQPVRILCLNTKCKALSGARSVTRLIGWWRQLTRLTTSGPRERRKTRIPSSLCLLSAYALSPENTAIRGGWVSCVCGQRAKTKITCPWHVLAQVHSRRHFAELGATESQSASVGSEVTDSRPTG